MSAFNAGVHFNPKAVQYCVLHKAESYLYLLWKSQTENIVPHFMDQKIQKTVLSNGLTVLSEEIPTVRSVAFGVWVKTGSRYESLRENGIAHFIEHLVFKGTKKRSALQIARSLEDLGGNLNAYTSKEITNFYAIALDRHLSTCVNVIADLVCNPLFREKDIEKEKQVVLEEINTVKDTPEEYIFDLFQEKLFPSHPLGSPILGTEERVTAFTRNDILAFWEKYYGPNNMIVAAAGHLQHDKLIHLIEKYFRLENNAQRVTLKKPEPAHGIRVDLKESFNQAHIVAGIDSVNYASPDRYALIALNAYLGGGMSSRLFQSIREHHGLAYTVYSAVDFFKDTGIFSVYLGTDARNRQKAVQLLFKEIEKITENPIRKSDMVRLREQLKGSLLLGLESTSHRMSRLAKNEIYFGRQIPISETIKNVDTLSADQLLELAKRLFKIDKFNIIQMSPDA